MGTPPVLHLLARLPLPLSPGLLVLSGLILVSFWATLSPAHFSIWLVSNGPIALASTPSARTTRPRPTLLIGYLLATLIARLFPQLTSKIGGLSNGPEEEREVIIRRASTCGRSTIAVFSMSVCVPGSLPPPSIRVPSPRYALRATNPPLYTPCDNVTSSYLELERDNTLLYASTRTTDS